MLTKEDRCRDKLYKILNKTIDRLKDLDYADCVDVTEEDLAKLDDIISIFNHITIDVELPF